jgi:hypothetical protein
MKNTRIIATVWLMLLLTVTVACQPDGMERFENSSQTKVPVFASLENETDLIQEPLNTPTHVSYATATPLIEVIVTSIPLTTQTTTGLVHITSEPEGAWASVINTHLVEQTPVTWTMQPGMYTVTLTLNGYEDWATSVFVSAGEIVSVITRLHRDYTITPIEELQGPLWYLRWSDDGQSLTYALSDERWPHHVRHLPVYQSWWTYNLGSRDKEALLPPQTRVTNSVRELLDICPFPLLETPPYPCSPTLQESPTSNRIAFSSGTLIGYDANTWLANIDGSDVIYVDDFPGTPEVVMWSRDDKWLLIGRYNAVSNTYYLVSSDGTFVESLEELTNTSHWRVQGAKPQFSPDGQKVAFVGIEGSGLTQEQQDKEEAYNLYVLDLTTMEHQLVSSRFGLIQWAQDGSGLYILDGSANTAGQAIDYILGGEVHYAELYYINLTQETYPEQKLASDIPLSLPYSGAWAYSPEINAMAGTFDVNGAVFAILFLD